MITFKQFLNEEDETDKEHQFVIDAALEYVHHCSNFKDIDHPLYRLSGSSWSSSLNHRMKTRVPRTRRSESLGGSGEQQKFLFALPGWEDYPPRRRSIFCSTTMNFQIDDPSDNGDNVLMIYPFDGVKIAVLPEEDLNTMNILRGVKEKQYMNLDDLFTPIDEAYHRIFAGTRDDTAINEPYARMMHIKKVFAPNGKFNSEAPGADEPDEIADKYAEFDRDDSHIAKLVRTIATEFPEALTPEKLGVKLVTSSQLDLPGPTRECWFSGKYLSIPYRYHEEFKQAVKDLNSKEEDVE